MLNSDRQPSSPVTTTLDELLSLHDETFVRCAYLTVLSRDPDPEGFAYYLKRLRAGTPKLEILAQLRYSREVSGTAVRLPGLDAALLKHRRHPVTVIKNMFKKTGLFSIAHNRQQTDNKLVGDEKLPGLDKTLRRYKWSQKALMGWVVRFFYNMEGDNSTERKLRGIENQVFIIREENSKHHSQMETALAGLHHLVTQQAHMLAIAVGGALRSNADFMADLPPFQQIEPVDLEMLSPRARDIYFKLIKSSTLNTGRRV